MYPTIKSSTLWHLRDLILASCTSEREKQLLLGDKPQYLSWDLLPLQSCGVPETAIAVFASVKQGKFKPST